jgi:NAD(P)-dependent dehydrogenase (short-subunit alcohol dehydrogenase family)
LGSGIRDPGSGIRGPGSGVRVAGSALRLQPWNPEQHPVCYNRGMPTGQQVIVTGASSGIGRATALRFARAGAAVLVVGRDLSALSEVAAAVEQEGGQSATLAVDVTGADAPSAIVNTAVGRFGGLTTLVNAAGIIGSGSLEATTDEQWDTMMDINARAPFRLMRAATAALIASKGSIVNVSSVTGLRSFPGVLAYCVSKSAIDQLTRCAALELAPKGVRVNAVNPGVVVSNLHRRGGMTEEAYAAFLEHSKATHPLGRAGEPHEIADLIFFLASPNAAWITGETISIDGGRHLTCAR